MVDTVVSFLDGFAIRVGEGRRAIGG